MLRGLRQQNLLYFSLQHDELGAIIIPGLQIKKLRLRVSVTCQGHLLVNSSTRIWTKFCGAAHQPPHDRGATLGSSWLSQGPQLGSFWFCQALVLYCYHLSLSHAFTILCSRFYPMYNIVQPIFSKQAPCRLETQKLVRHSCFPPGAFTPEECPPIEIQNIII